MPVNDHEIVTIGDHSFMKRLRNALFMNITLIS